MDNDNTIHIDTFIPYMRDVARCERSLHELNLMWRLIESSAKMNCAEEAQSRSFACGTGHYGLITASLRELPRSSCDND